MIIQDFGKISGGGRAGVYILRNKNGISAAVTNYGAALVDLIVPDRNGRDVDVVLGYDDAAGYQRGTSYFGGTVGRVANRIGGARFEMNGKTYELTANHGPNALHGGRDSYVHRIWEATVPFTSLSSRTISAAYALESLGDERSGFEKVDPDCDSIAFTLVSHDGDQGFPGKLAIRVTYTLTDDNELHIDYSAKLIDVTEEVRETPVNLTNHSYFNLSGHDSGTILDQILEVKADRFTISDENLLPTGEVARLGGTPMDFRTAKAIGQDIGADYEALRFGGGYDHNYVVASPEEIAETVGSVPGMGRYKKVASLYSHRTGIEMSVLTDLPGLQVYTSNGLSGEPGKRGALYGRNSAVCLETQFWPDAVNHENFPGGVLRAGEEFKSRTTFCFTTRD